MTRTLGADRLHLLTVFVAVVEAKGFASAARKLNISPPAATRAIAERERQLGVRLLTTSNDSAIASALNGQGLIGLRSDQVLAHLESGSLLEVLADHAPPPLPLHLVHREERYASSKARAFLDLAMERQRGEPALAAVTRQAPTTLTGTRRGSTCARGS